MCVIANSCPSATTTFSSQRLLISTQEMGASPHSADSARPAHERYDHLGWQVYEFTSGSAHTEMFSNSCAAVTHPENLTNNATQEPALRNSQRNLLTLHHRFHYQWCITFPALCILFLIEGRGGKKNVQTTYRKKPPIYSQPKIAANNGMYHSVVCDLLWSRIWLLYMVYVCVQLYLHMSKQYTLVLV